MAYNIVVELYNNVANDFQLMDVITKSEHGLLRDANYCIRNKVGVIVREVSIMTNKLNGESHTRYDDDKPRTSECYYNGNLHGKNVNYFYNGDDVYTTIKYMHHGLEHGQTSIYQNEKLIKQHYMKYDVYNGPYKSWFDNDQLCVDCYYHNGKLDGKYKRWFENGQLETECCYRDGKLDDKYDTYEGMYRKWYSDEQICDHRNYINGNNYDGLSEELYGNYELAIITNYKHKKLVNYKIFNNPKKRKVNDCNHTEYTEAKRMKQST
jgi:antitoxin component YwqK of YwqJK toxin-antitoxin module